MEIVSESERMEVIGRAVTALLDAKRTSAELKEYAARLSQRVHDIARLVSGSLDNADLDVEQICDAARIRKLLADRKEAYDRLLNAQSRCRELGIDIGS